MVFDRTALGESSVEKVIGVGHKVFDKALKVAAEYPVSLAWTQAIEHPLVVFQVYDRVTDQSGLIRQVVVGVERDENAGNDGWIMLRDWQVLETLNSIKQREPKQDTPPFPETHIWALIKGASRHLSENIDSFNFPFKIPEIKPLACLWASK